MDRLKKMFNREFSKIGEAAIVLAFFTFLSQILAIFRDRFLTGNIGTGTLLDTYYAAFRIPDILFTLGASLVSVSILMPYFRAKLKDSREQGKSFIDDVFTAFAIFMLLSALVMYILMPSMTEVLFPGLSGDELVQTIKLSRVMLLSPVLLGVSNLFATITQTFKKFFVYALSPIFYNLGIILGVVILYPMFGPTGLAWGVVLGSLLHMLIQLPVVFTEGFLPRLKGTLSWDSLRDVLIHSLPRTLTLSMPKLVFLVFVSLASTLAPGAISVFNLSYNLQSVPLAIIGVSYSIAAFPLLVEYYTNKNFDKFMSHVIGPIKQIAFWSLPIIALFVVLRAQIVRVILGSGAFDWSDTRLTAASLALFIISVIAQGVVMLLIRAYYASGKTWKPFWLNLGSSIGSVLFAFILTWVFKTYPAFAGFVENLLRISGVEGSSVVMLSLAYSLGMFVSLGLLLFAFKRDFNTDLRGYGIRKSFLQSFVASFAMGVVGYGMLNVTVDAFNQSRTIGVFFHAFVAGISAIIIGIIILKIMKNEEITLFLKVLKKKIWNNKIIGIIQRGM